MKYITKEDVNDFIPSRINISLAESKGLALNGELRDEYFLLQSIYVNLLEIYLSSLFNIESIEQKLSSANFRSVEDEEKDIYQYLSNNKYFYIRNTMYVEKLSNEDIKLLLSKKDEVSDPNLISIICKTYKDVITTDDFKMQEFNISYGPQTGSYFKPNNSLVIGFRLAEEDESLYSSSDEWFKDYCARRQYISNLLPKLEEEFNSKINCECSILEYNEESVKKKTSNNYTK